MTSDTRREGTRRPEKVGTLAMTARKSLQMAGATGLEPATFDVTGRTKCNGINDSCKFFCG